MNTQPQAPSPTVEDYLAADLAMLQRLADLGMQMIELTTHQAVQHVQAQLQAAQDLAPGEPRPAPTSRNDPRLVFERLARTVSSIVALKHRIATSRRPAAGRPAPVIVADPRREGISAYLHDAIEGSPLARVARADLHDRVESRIDEHLLNDPKLTRAGGDIALEICDELGIDFEMSRMDDSLLVPPGKSTPTGYEEFLARQQPPPPP